MFLVQTALWIVQFSMLIYLICHIIFNIKDKDYNEIFIATITFGVASAILQMFIYGTTKL